MAWTINYSEIALKQLKKLDKSVRRKIIDYLSHRVAHSDDRKKMGKPLLYEKSGLWRYRVEDYRIICQIQDNELTVLVLKIGHRKEVYE